MGWPAVAPCCLVREGVAAGGGTLGTRALPVGAGSSSVSVATYVGSSTVAVCRAAAASQQCPFPLGSTGDCLPPPWILRRRLHEQAQPVQLQHADSPQPLTDLRQRLLAEYRVRLTGSGSRPTPHGAGKVKRGVAYAASYYWSEAPQSFLNLGSEGTLGTPGASDWGSGRVVWS